MPGLRSILATSLGALALASCGGGQGGGGGSGVIARPSSPPPTVTPTPTPPATLQLVWSDEFDAGALDRDVWTVEGPSFFVNNEQQAYIDSAETISFSRPAGADGGALVLKPVWQENYTTPTGREVDFVSGRINTRDKVNVTYGKVAARIRMPVAVGVWPAFWMLGYGQWPDSGETDIMEYVGDPTWVNSAIHGPGYSGDTPILKRYYFPQGQDVSGWHTYAVERTPDALIFSVDDIEYYRVTKADIERYGAWRFDREQYIILNFAVGGVYPFNVNSIDTPYYGVPQETVDRIKGGELAMEVDWVRVWEPR